MKIRFKKLQATPAFIKLFGINKEAASDDATRSETEDGYEYYYKRGHTYYFRNGEGDKIAVDYPEPPGELVRGRKYPVNRLHPNS